MQCLITLETERDLVAVCRVMNVFRRKGLNLVALTLADRPAGFSFMAIVESADTEVDHIFNFLRRSGGVQHVTYYRHEPSQDASFIFIDADADNSRVARVLEAFPGSHLIFASHGKYLLEMSADSRRQALTERFVEPEILPFACVRTTRNVARQELVGAP
jgi:acetolactate synthase small subunit